MKLTFNPTSRYNLKRRVASLPPLSSEIFAEKVITAQASSSAAAAKASFEKSCVACQRTYYSENAYQNHISSQKHKTREASWKKNGSTADETGSVMSAPFSLGEPVNTPGQTKDVEEEDAHISEVVDGLQDTSLEDHRAPRSRNTTANEKRQEQSSQRSEATDDDAPKEEYPVSRCLFCNYDSPNLKLNIFHMSKFHGMFLPEQEYLVDLEGLIRYFHAKISVNNECLYCHTIKTTTPGIQTHMRDKGHCMIAFETEEEMVEVGQFYDFTSTYSDDEEEDEDEDDSNANTPRKGGVKVSKSGGADAEQDGWETDSSASSLDSDELCAVPLDDRSHQYSKLPQHRHHSNGSRPHRNADGFHSHAHEHSHAAFYSDYELHLPSGRTAGHRSLAKYYRQNLHNHPTAEERISRQLAIEEGSDESEDNEDETTRKPSRALTTRANGMLGATESQKREVRIAEKKERNRERRLRAQYEWGVNKRGNSQKHFRVSFNLLFSPSNYYGSISTDILFILLGSPPSMISSTNLS